VFMFCRLAGILPRNYDETEAALAKTECRQPNYNPEYSLGYKYLRYFLTFHAFVDCASSMPLWFYWAAQHGSIYALSYSMQSFRIVRLVRLFKIGGNFLATVALFYRAIKLAAEPLFVITFMFLLLLIVFGIVFFELEGGEFEVTAAYPSGAFLRSSPDLLPSPVESVFDSISTSIYFSGVTMTSLGFGDLYPYTRSGRAMAIVVAITGVLMFSLPMTVVFTNFDREYQKYVKIVEIQKNFNSTLNHEVQTALDMNHDQAVFVHPDNNSSTVVVETVNPLSGDSSTGRETTANGLSAPDFRPSVAPSRLGADDIRESIISCMVQKQGEQYGHGLMLAAGSRASINIPQRNRGSVHLVGDTSRSRVPFRRKGGLVGSPNEGSEADSDADSRGVSRAEKLIDRIINSEDFAKPVQAFDDDELRQHATQLLTDYSGLQNVLNSKRAALEEMVAKYKSLLDSLK
jgi:hypothetical protein